MIASSGKHRDTSAILADIGAIRNPVAGTLTVVNRPLKGGGSYPHCHLQHWRGGRNVTTYVPPDRVEGVRAGIEARRRMESLMAELAAAGAAAALAGEAEDAVKKKRRSPSPGSRGRSRG